MLFLKHLVKVDFVGEGALDTLKEPEGRGELEI